MAYWIECVVDEKKFMRLCELKSIAITYVKDQIGLSFASMNQELMKDGVIRLAEIYVSSNSFKYKCLSLYSRTNFLKCF